MSEIILSGESRRIRERLKNDLEHYAKKCLWIRTKNPVMVDGRLSKLAPFVFNKAQRYLHQQLQAQAQETGGKIRALLLKGRQQGCSTYVGGRFYHLTTHNPGFKSFILTHRDDATANLFTMVKRYHEHCPEVVRPHTSYSSRKELVFDRLDSSYALGTAGSGDVARSDTIDLFHGSEVAFWKNTDDIKTGAFQAAEGAKEIILESTANGLGNMFFEMWQDAEAGLSEYKAIFIPWYWQDEYYLKPPRFFELDPEEQEYRDLYGLTDGQIYWRRQKLLTLKDPLLFKQEYPATASEAFQTTGTDSFIKPEPVILARKRKNIVQRGPHIVGLDPARGGDRTALIHRQGLVAWGLEAWKTPDTRDIIGRVHEIMSDESPKGFVDRLFIDIGGLGGPLLDIMRDLPWSHRVTAVNFGSTDVFDKERYKNKRAEMYGDMRSWLEDTVELCSIPDLDTLQADICAPGYHYDSLQRLLMESKKDMVARGLRSNDESDALALTFAMPVRKLHPDNNFVTTLGRRSNKFVPFAL